MTDRLAPRQVAGNASDAPGRASTLMKTLLRSEWPWMLYLAFVALLVVFSLASPWFLSVDKFSQYRPADDARLDRRGGHDLRHHCRPD